ncbi:MAG: helix-turn-helix transcriptional regulator [Rhodospirillales bacterium]|nr:helix-turn-helix transcriptional regulator [Acetobacter sp.]
MRKERGWSLSYMHLTHGYVPSHWQRIEKGKTITVDTMLRIADLFDETLGSLVRSLGVFPRRDKERAQTPDVLNQELSRERQAT